MTTDQFLVVVVLLTSLLLFASGRFRVAVVALSVLVALVLTGVLETQEALSGLSNPAVVTVFAVFILSGALVKTGVADQLAEWMLGVAGTQQRRVVAVLMLTCGLMSAFMNNIGATAILLPAALVMAERTGIARVQAAHAFGIRSLLGGNMTAIGNPRIFSQMESWPSTPTSSRSDSSTSLRPGCRFYSGEWRIWQSPGGGSFHLAPGAVA